MRTPFVTRHTTPLSGFLLFCPPCGAGRAQPPVSWAAWIAVHGCQRCGAAPNPSCGALSPAVTMAEAQGGAPRRPSTAVVPSSRPPQKAGGGSAARPGGSGAGAGQDTVPWGGHTPLLAEPARVSTHSAGRRARGPRRPAACAAAAMLGCMAVEGRRIPAGARAAPGARALLPEGPRHGSSAPAMWRCSLPERARARVGAQRRRAWPVAGFGSTRARDVGPGRVPAEEQRSGCSKGRWEVGVAPRVPRRPPAVAPGGLRPGDEATRRRQSLPPGHASALGHGGEPDEAQDGAKARDGVAAGQGLGLVWLRRGEEKEGKSVPPLRIRGEESAVALQGLWHGDRRTTRGDPGTVGFGGQLLAERGPGRRAGGLGHRRAKVRALAHQGRAASEQSAGGALVRRASPRLVAAGHRGAAPHSFGQRSWRLWPCRRAWLAWSAPAPARRGGRLRPSSRRARPRCRDTRRPRPRRHERVPQPGATVQARRSWCGGAAWRPRGARCRRPYAGPASRDRSTRGAEWWRIALRSPPRSGVAFSQGQHTTGVGCGGGLNHYRRVREARLLSPPPLRTGRESFPSSGSSLE